MKIDGKEISKEVLAQAINCDTPEELMELAKKSGLDITKQEAEAFLSEMDEMDLTHDQLQQVAGGKVWSICSVLKR